MVDEDRLVLYKGQKIDVRQTADFRDWLEGLRDRRARLLTGGDKGSQSRDIARSKRLAKEADDGIENLPV